MEPTTAVGGGLALLGAKDVVVKLLGPTADYLGGGLKDYTTKGCENISRVFKLAINCLGERVEKPGQVPPKVLKEVLNQGYFCEDQLCAEYLGGVLASSRTEVGRDDRAASVMSVIGRLSSYQVRCHYLFYSAFAETFRGEESNLGLGSERTKLGVFVPSKSLTESMEYGPGEFPDALQTHILTGLEKEELIAKEWASARPEVVKTNFQFEASGHGIIWKPTLSGIELFAWAQGMPNLSLRDFLDPDTAYRVIPGIKPLANVQRTTKV